MFGLSFGELVIIFGVALLVLGPKGLPEMARKLGGWMRQFRSATSELRGTFESEFYKLDGGPASPVRPAMRSVEGVVPRPSGPSSAVMPRSGPGVPDAALQSGTPAPPAAAPEPPARSPFEAALETGTSAPPAAASASPAAASEPAPPEAPAKPPEGAA